MADGVDAGKYAISVIDPAQGRFAAYHDLIQKAFPNEHILI
jgi:hypothetical protein